MVYTGLSFIIVKIPDSFHRSYRVQMQNISVLQCIAVKPSFVNISDT